MKRYCLLIFILVTICVSCKDRRPDGQIGRAEIIIDLDSLAKKSPLGIFESKDERYIPLQTIEESLIGDIKKVIYRDGRFYINDRTSDKIVVFDNNGKYITNIDKKGRGPNEYLKIDDFCVDNNMNVIVYCNMTVKLLKYIYPDYKQAETVMLDKKVLKVQTVGNSIFVSSVINITDKNRKFIPLGRLTEDNKIEATLPSRDILDDVEAVFQGKPLHFYDSEGVIYFNPRLSADLFIMTSEGVSPYMTIKSKDIVTAQNKKEENERRLIYGFNSVFRTGNIILADIWTSKLDFDLPALIIYDLETGQSDFIPYRNKTGYSLFAETVCGDNFVYTEEAVSVMRKADLTPGNAALVSAATGLNENDNPVLVEFSIRRKAGN